MGRTIIVGAGDFGRELDAWVAQDSSISRSDPRYFLDDNSGALRKYPHLEPRLMGSIESFEPEIDDLLFLGISDPETKEFIVTKLNSRSIELATFIHSSVITSSTLDVGQGTVICPGVIISVGARLDACVTLNLQSTVGHDTEVGAFSSIMSHVDLTGHSKIGKGAYVGSHATILPGVVVEDWALVGAGSVVTRRVPAGTTVFGVPAKQLSKK